MSLVDRVCDAANRFSNYFDALPAVPFLHDTTTKNVLVHDGRFSGIVDVDSLCYGDWLYTPALTRAALLGGGLNPDYVEISWCGALGLDREQKGAMDFYSALFCVEPDPPRLLPRRRRRDSPPYRRARRDSPHYRTGRAGTWRQSDRDRPQSEWPVTFDKKR